MAASERNMVLADWKRDLASTPSVKRGWGRGLTGYEMWCVLDHVIDRISFPSAEVVMACAESEPKVPLAWVAMRGPRILHEHMRERIVEEDPELAAALAQEVWSKLPSVLVRQPFNPIHELKESA